MKKELSEIAFVFPGQGSQYVGMGQEIFDNYKEAREIYNTADKVLGIPLTKLCFEGPENELKLTVNTQPAILTTSIAMLSALKKEGIAASCAAGHSLGEYSALVAAGSISFSDALWLVRKRGQYMQDAVPQGEGTMAAIIGMDVEKLIQLCAENGGLGIVELANFNAPSQIVISGKTDAVKTVVEKAKIEGAKMALILQVSGPFHSSLLEPAADKLEKDLHRVDFKSASIRVIANVNAEEEIEPETIKRNLKNQVFRAVLWQQSVEKMINTGINTFIEVGPGKVLSGLIKKVDKNLEMYNIENISTLTAAINGLGGGSSIEQ